MRAKLVQFLKEDLALPETAIALLNRHEEPMPNLLSMVLWQYGLITLEELNRIFDWLESA